MANTFTAIQVRSGEGGWRGGREGKGERVRERWEGGRGLGMVEGGGTM